MENLLVTITESNLICMQDPYGSNKINYKVGDLFIKFLYQDILLAGKKINNLIDPLIDNSYSSSFIKDTINKIKPILVKISPLFEYYSNENILMEIVLQYATDYLIYITRKENATKLSFSTFLIEEILHKIVGGAKYSTFYRYTDEEEKLIEFLCNRYTDEIHRAEEYIIDTPSSLIHLFNLQNRLKQWILNVLDIDNSLFNHFDSRKRFFILSNLNSDLINSDFCPHVNFKCIPIEDAEGKSKILYDTLKENAQVEISDISKLINNLNFLMIEEFDVSNFEQFYYLEFIKMVETGVLIRKCNNCGKYFVIENMNTKYCNRINKGMTKPCSTVGSNKAFTKKMEEDKALRIYNKAYKTHYARVKNGKGKKTMSQSEFNHWYLDAKVKLKQTRSGEMDIVEFEAWLKK